MSDSGAYTGAPSPGSMKSMTLRDIGPTSPADIVIRKAVLYERSAGRKVQEIDTNSDGIKDILKFEAQFYTDKPIKSLKLLLFFNFTLKELFQVVMESIAVLNHMLNDEVQKVQFSGDLTLEQKGLLNSEGLYKMYNHSIDVADYSLEELLKQNANRKC
ncbi:hypothetical protein WN55_05330 [Dufourea novaeangliae]|uniref:Transmembrane protein 231 n=1 Tax=Dufourea novaeangliae TaxID=178035 RepID=A0A154PNC7_DUFNO|nr:hypothetical protein WN55_05330 [Dufourea novaeangliae]